MCAPQDCSKATADTTGRECSSCIAAGRSRATSAASTTPADASVDPVPGPGGLRSPAAGVPIETSLHTIAAVHKAIAAAAVGAAAVGAAAVGAAPQLRASAGELLLYALPCQCCQYPTYQPPSRVYQAFAVGTALPQSCSVFCSQPHQF